MILPDFILPSRVNQHWQYSGMDSIKECRDKKHFRSYPHKIDYKYNTRGFRDAEWPDSIEELQKSIWCIGDSFTVGVGSPIEHTWSNILQHTLGKRCINVSMDGASNDWIARRAEQIITTVQPEHLIIHWSFWTRRELNDPTLPDEERRIFSSPYELDLDINFEKFKNSVERIDQYNNTCKITHSLILPVFDILDYSLINDEWNKLKGPDWPQDLPSCYKDIPEFVIEELKNFQAHEYLEQYYFIKEQINPWLNAQGFIEKFDQVDYARDGFHYGTTTAQCLADKILIAIS